MFFIFAPRIERGSNCVPARIAVNIPAVVPFPSLPETVMPILPCFFKKSPINSSQLSVLIPCAFASSSSGLLGFKAIIAGVYKTISGFPLVYRFSFLCPK